MSESVRIVGGCGIASTINFLAGMYFCIQDTTRDRKAWPLISRERLMVATLNAIADISAESSPLEERLSKSLDEIDKRFGFRRSALVYHSRGTAPVLFAHARGTADAATFGNDMRNVQFILSNMGDKGVIRSALNKTKSIILNDVTDDPRYLAADEHSVSEACIVHSLSKTSNLALNVESSTPGAITAHEIDFLTSVADFLAMMTARNASLLFDLRGTWHRTGMALH